jgi:UDP-N-acetylglucosamine transferase subunit ALG13
VIFATVGTQLAFHRFLSALDRIAGAHGLEVFAQTCGEEEGFQHIQSSAHLSPADYESYIHKADRVVGHAGIGTIIAARRAEKPLILFPRRAALGEHRNDHQLATVQSFADRSGIYIAHDEAMLEELLLRNDLEPLRHGDSPARLALIARLRDFISH